MAKDKTTNSSGETEVAILEQINNLIDKLDPNEDKVLINKLLDKISEKRISGSTFNALSDNTQIDDIYNKVIQKTPAVWKSPIPKHFFTISGILAFITFVVIVSTYIFKFKAELEPMKMINYFLYFIWAMGPPSFFFYEYMWKFPHKLDANQMADLKYTHELASKIWAALLVVFGVLLYTMYGMKKVGG